MAKTIKKKQTIKVICGQPVSKGKCKRQVLKGKTKCYLHSLNNNELCGKLTKKNKLCGSLKGRCKHHDNIVSQTNEEKEICKGKNRNGTSCKNHIIQDSIYCFTHSFKKNEFCGACGAKLSKSGNSSKDKNGVEEDLDEASSDDENEDDENVEEDEENDEDE